MLIRKEGNGWWLVKKLETEEQGWAPSAYLEEIEVKKSVPPPPPPPASRPNGVVGKKKPPAPPKRPNVAAKAVGVSTPDRNSSGTSTSGDSFAGGLAEAVSVSFFL
jgi:myosin-1